MRVTALLDAQGLGEKRAGRDGCAGDRGAEAKTEAGGEHGVGLKM